MPENVERIKLKDREIILIGTAHVSKSSQKLVEETIEKEKPDTVGIELCAQRYKTVTDKNSWKNMKISKVIKENKTFLLLSSLLLSSFQRKIGDRIGIEPGSEMISATAVAKKNNIEIELLDRNIQITLKRAWANLSFFTKFRMIYNLIIGFFVADEIDEKAIEKMKDKNIMNEMMAELSREFPQIKKTLIDERDKYLATNIINSKSKKMVAVLGAGHIDGVMSYIRNHKTYNLKKLETIPKKFPIGKVIGYTIPLLFVSLVIYGFYTSGADTTIDMLIKWFLINGTLSALFTIIVLPHPLTVISAFLAAPFTSLNPTIAAGWVAGLVEATIRQPRVGDLKDLHSDVCTIKGFVNNRVTKILAVVALANIGSTIGTLVAFPYILSLL